jgi:hypothetical protein
MTPSPHTDPHHFISPSTWNSGRDKKTTKPNQRTDSTEYPEQIIQLDIFFTLSTKLRVNQENP